MIKIKSTNGAGVILTLFLYALFLTGWVNNALYVMHEAALMPKPDFHNASWGFIARLVGIICFPLGGILGWF